MRRATSNRGRTTLTAVYRAHCLFRPSARLLDSLRSPFGPGLRLLLRFALRSASLGGFVDGRAQTKTGRKSQS
jgi:hypothetical protein